MSDRDSQSTLGPDREPEEADRRDPLLGLLDEGVCRLDADGALVEVNGAFVDALGRARSDLLGEELSTFVVPADRPRLAAVLRWYDSEDTTAGVRFDAVRVRFVTGDGERLARELRLDAARSTGPGTTVAVVRGLPEDGPTETSPALSALVDDLPGLAYRCRDPDGTPEFVSDGCLDVAGYDPHALESGAVSWRGDVVHPEDRDRVREAVRDALARRDSFAVEYRIRPAEGGTRTVSEVGRAIGNPDGGPVAIDGLIVDVSDRTTAGDSTGVTGERRPSRTHVDRVVRRINTGIVRQSTREEIERVVCERLAGSDAFEAAWIGEVDSGRERVRLRTGAGIDDHRFGTDVRIEGERGEGPTGRAVRTGEMQVVSDVRADPASDPRRDHAGESGYRSFAAIPIRYEGTCYGVLNVYADGPDAFAGERRAVVGQLGTTVGHAIAALERKRALMNDELVEVELRLRDLAGAFDLPDAGGTIRFERVIPLGDGEYVEHGRATPDMVETLRLLPERLGFVEAVDVREESDGCVRFESVLSEPPLSCVVATHGSRITESVVRDGDHHVVVQLPPGTDVRRIIERVRESYPDVEYVSQRQVTDPSTESGTMRTPVLGDLTGRQRTVLESAYYAGFFEWPRETTGEEVAGTLGIAGSTFHQHLRKAEATVLEALLSEVVVSA